MNAELRKAREVARNIARGKGTVTADDVYFAMKGKEIGRLAGGLFKGKEWEWTGDVITSVRPQAHSYLLRVWRLK